MFLFVVFFPSSEELDMPQQAYFSFSLKSKEIFLYEEVEKKKPTKKTPTMSFFSVHFKANRNKTLGRDISSPQESKASITKIYLHFCAA